jgi:hypothetical protein
LTLLLLFFFRIVIGLKEGACGPKALTLEYGGWHDEDRDNGFTGVGRDGRMGNGP